MKKQPVVNKKKVKIPPTVEGLVEQGNKALSKLQPELAVTFFQRALEMSPEDTNIMDALADVLIQLGDPNSALQLLVQSTSLAPETNPFKWLFLAQLQQGADALTSYRNAISILSANLSEDIVIDEKEKDMMTKQVVKAYTSIAELYLTDLCYEECAETLCYDAIKAALLIDADSIDANQALVSLRLSQSNPEEASLIIELIYARVKQIRDKARERTIIDELIGVEDVDSDDSLEPEFCIATAKLLIECGSHKPELIESAMELVGDLLQDDDENIELWYIMGVAAMSLSPPDVENAHYHLNIAKDMMDKLLEVCEEQEFPYTDQYRILQEHLAIINGMEQTAPEVDSGVFNTRGHNTNNQVSMEEEEEWSTCEEDEINGDDDEEES